MQADDEARQNKLLQRLRSVSTATPFTITQEDKEWCVARFLDCPTGFDEFDLVIRCFTAELTRSLGFMGVSVEDAREHVQDMFLKIAKNPDNATFRKGMKRSVASFISEMRRRVVENFIDAARRSRERGELAERARSRSLEEHDSDSTRWDPTLSEFERKHAGNAEDALLEDITYRDAMRVIAGELSATQFLLVELVVMHRKGKRGDLDDINAVATELKWSERKTRYELDKIRDAMKDLALMQRLGYGN